MYGTYLDHVVKLPWSSRIRQIQQIWSLSSQVLNIFTTYLDNLFQSLTVFTRKIELVFRWNLFFSCPISKQHQEESGCLIIPSHLAFAYLDTISPESSLFQTEKSHLSHLFSFLSCSSSIKSKSWFKTSLWLQEHSQNP